MKDQIEIILTTCNDVLNLDVCNVTRKEEYIVARSIFFTVCKVLLPNSTSSGLGKFTNKDHATVLHSLNQFEVYAKDSKIFDLYEKCLYRSCDKLGIEHILKEKEEDFLYDKIRELSNKCGLLEDKLTRIENPLIKEILGLNTYQYKLFEERCGVILKAIRGYKTYDNTPKKEFNASNLIQ